MRRREFIAGVGGAALACRLPGAHREDFFWGSMTAPDSDSGVVPMTDDSKQSNLRQLRSTKRHISSRAFSILFAIIADILLIWLLFFQQSWRPIAEEVESFWVWAFIAFAVYAVVQMWTLAYQTGQGDELTATVDKIFAASPAIVVAIIEVYWIGHDSTAALSWRHHVVAVVSAIFAITDFFATDITNQRLRMRQMNLGQQGD
jgi:hypothetical protein